ncbi:hypothetical protein [Mucilaginibacter auburnensis]|uniref:MG2 domain-containing protein n=1 Tax=Mucilaginibacter auburnensis TaxID=1457233 RepID=A0A2H9VQ34_9SPHI|nr:hypothetical protein [Mucilaginibacter auburnensis]PJJ80443.1 hypothetical protein CLV57_3594 [Mucilaginibacter auburnensis]
MPLVLKVPVFACSLLLCLNLLCGKANAQIIEKRPASSTVQTNFDSLISYYAASRHSPALFIHFDKNVYSNNENVWFTGYLLNYTDAALYNTLSLALVKNDDRSVVMDDRFIISGGFCFGNTNIPDSVRSGAYTFVAYTNRLQNGKPEVLFTQQITVKTETVQTFNASLNPLDTSATAVNQKVMLLVTFMDVNAAPATLPVIYYVGDARKPVTTGAVKTALGQYIFNISSKLLSAGNNTLHVQVKYKDEIHDVKMKLPVPQQPPKVQFFPEGGNLINGIVNLVGWEIKSDEGAPLLEEASLYEDDKLIDAFTSNGYGLGKFYLVPQAGKKYSLRLKRNDGKAIYNLPAVINGATLIVRHAVVNDTLMVDVYNNDGGRHLHLLGHNYEHLFFDVPIEKNPIQRVKIVLNNMPRGLMQLTLVDSSGNAYAARSVFAHYNNNSNITITTDNNSYGTRKKVRVSLKLEGQNKEAAVSIAVVQANRVEIKNSNDIESFIHLKQHLSGIPVRENYFENSEFARRDLEDILLIKGWSRYKWTDVLTVQPHDTVKTATDLVFTGKAVRNFGKMKAPITILTVEPTSTYETDMSGNFTLPDNNIVTLPGKKVGIMVAARNMADFSIKVVNPYDSLNRYMAGIIEPFTYYSPAQENSNALQLPGSERAIRLKEVTIKDKKEDDFFATGPNPCGDYICVYNILNCPNHRGASDCKPPVKGATYRSGINGTGTVVYQGCNQTSGLKFKGIYAPQDFYPSDYSELNPSQPEYLSTIYWKNQLMLKKGETKELSFYTSDITGPFKIIIQGVTNTDVIHQQASFRVSK